MTRGRAPSLRSWPSAHPTFGQTVTDEECAEAWAESEASATCTDTIAEADVGDEWSIETTCTSDGITTSMEASLIMRHVNLLIQCDGALFVDYGPCTPEPDTEEELAAMTEQCEEELESTPAATSCTSIQVTVEWRDSCQIEATCTDDEGASVPAAKTTPLNEIADLNVCNGVILLTPCGDVDELDMAGKCMHHWEKSKASETCESTGFETTEELDDFCAFMGHCTTDDGRHNDQSHYGMTTAELERAVNCNGLMSICTGECPKLYWPFPYDIIEEDEEETDN